MAYRICFELLPHALEHVETKVNTSFSSWSIVISYMRLPHVDTHHILFFDLPRIKHRSKNIFCHVPNITRAALRNAFDYLSCLPGNGFALPGLAVEVGGRSTANGGFILRKTRRVKQGLIDQLLLAKDTSNRLVVGKLGELEQESVVDGRLGLLVRLGTVSLCTIEITQGILRTSIKNSPF